MTEKTSCVNSDSTISFSNRDDLEWNQKKHHMILNLGLTNNTETDQTPTPTRFIRNCEEVGLFQDLQNVNPFDEVFKHAVENPSSIGLQVPTSTTDDSLHTPQIYPQIDQSSKYSNSSIANEFELISGIDASIEQRDDADNPEDNPLIIVLDLENDNETTKTSNKDDCNNTTPTKGLLTDHVASNTREKIKATIIKKSGGVTPVPIEKLLGSRQQHPKNVNQDGIDMEGMLKQREANKAAQNRCRKRKQLAAENLKTENNKLKRENSNLKSLNSFLHDTVNKLQEELKVARLTNSASTETPVVQTKHQSPSIKPATAVAINQPKKNCNILPKTLAKTSTNNGTSQNINFTPPIQSNLNSPMHNNICSTLQKGPQKPKLPAPVVSNTFPNTVVLSLPLQNNSNTVQTPSLNSENNLAPVLLVYPRVPPKIIMPQNSKNDLRHQFKTIMPK